MSRIGSDQPHSHTVVVKLANGRILNYGTGIAQNLKLARRFAALDLRCARRSAREMGTRIEQRAISIVTA